MTVWVLFIIVMLNGKPTIDYTITKDETTCQAVKAKLTEEFIKRDGGFEGSITCTASTIARAI